MRSQKQVRRVGKVRCSKNAAAGKRRTFRKRLEARKAWQHNTVMTGRHHFSDKVDAALESQKAKDLKQSSAQELSKKQQLRKQRRMEKGLAKQKASTSALPKAKNEEKKEVGGIVPKNAQIEHGHPSKTVNAKKLVAPKKTTSAKHPKTEQKQPTASAQKNTSKKVYESKQIRKHPKSKGQSNEKQTVSVKESGGVKDGLKQKLPHGGKKSIPSEIVNVAQKSSMHAKKKKADRDEIDAIAAKKKRSSEENDELEPSIATAVVAPRDSATPTAFDARKENEKKATLNADKHGDVKPDSNKKLAEKAELKKDWEVVGTDEVIKTLEQNQDNIQSTEKMKEKKNQRLSVEHHALEDDFVEDELHDICGSEFVVADSQETIEEQKQQHEKPEEHSVAPRDEKLLDKARGEEIKDERIEPVNAASKPQEQQANKQKGHTSEKQDKKLFTESVTVAVENQNTPGSAIEKTAEHTTLSSGDIPKDDEAVAKTEKIIEVISTEELRMNVANLAEHSKLVDSANEALDGAIAEMTITTYKNEAKHEEVNTEKREPVVLALEREKVGTVQPVRERIYKLLPRDIQFCVSMIEKHGEDYEAMAKDDVNIYRDSAKGIARKIRIFKKSPQYEAYLKQKADQDGAAA